LDVAYPERLSRGLVLVKWWLLAIPQYIVVGILLGGGSYAASQVDQRLWGLGFETGLIGVLVLFAAVALLFTTRYPRGLFDLVLGLDRWVARVAAYVLLMRDEYPPFRLDQGGRDGSASIEDEAPVAAVDATAVPKARGAGSAGKVALIAIGVVVGIVAFGLLAGGCALVAIDRTQRDDDGFLMSPSQEFSTPTYAIVSESADIDADGSERALDSFLGTVRVRSESDRDLFVGIGPAAEVELYLDGVEQDVVTGFDDEDPTYTRRAGAAPSAPPGSETFWVASATGSGEQALEWDTQDGDWRAVVMDEDAARGVSAEMSIGAELDSVLWIGIGLLAAGGLLAGGAALAITAGIRRGQH
jgi:hypothetical protein